MRVRKEDKNIFRWLNKAVSKDKDTFEKYKYIFIKQGEAVATEGHILNLAKIGRYYDTLHTGYYIYKKGELIEKYTPQEIGKYVDYEGLIKRVKLNTFLIEIYNPVSPEDIINKIYKKHFEIVDGTGLNPYLLLDSLSIINKKSTITAVKTYFPADNSPLLIEYLWGKTKIIALSLIAPMELSKP